MTLINSTELKEIYQDAIEKDEEWENLCWVPESFAEKIKIYPEVYRTSFSNIKIYSMKIKRMKEIKIKVIYCAANKNYKVIENEKNLGYIRKKYNLPNRFILFVGTIELRKNIVRLLKAFSEVYKKIPIPLVITGKLGWKYKKI